MAATTHDADAIRAAVAAAEAKTSAEIVVVIARRSDDYGAARVGLASLVALATALGALRYAALDATLVVVLQIPVYLLAWIALGAPRVLSLVVPDAREADAVARAADAAYGAHRVGEVGGVLVYLSEQERMVRVLADPRARDALGPGALADAARAVADAAKQGRAPSAIVDVVARFGEARARALPKTSGDANALPDVVGR